MLLIEQTWDHKTSYLKLHGLKTKWHQTLGAKSYVNSWLRLLDSFRISLAYALHHSEFQFSNSTKCCVEDLQPAIASSFNNIVSLVLVVSSFQLRFKLYGRKAAIHKNYWNIFSLFIMFLFVSILPQLNWFTWNSFLVPVLIILSLHAFGSPFRLHSFSSEGRKYGLLLWRSVCPRGCRTPAK